MLAGRLEKEHPRRLLSRYVAENMSNLLIMSEIVYRLVSAANSVFSAPGSQEVYSEAPRTTAGTKPHFAESAGRGDVGSVSMSGVGIGV